MNFQPADVPGLPLTLEETETLFNRIVEGAIDQNTDEALYSAFAQIYISHRVAHNSLCAFNQVLASESHDVMEQIPFNRPELIAGAAHMTELCSLALDAQARLLEFLPEHPRSE